jgi:hypothetical protein
VVRGGGVDEVPLLGPEGLAFNDMAEISTTGPNSILAINVVNSAIAPRPTAATKPCRHPSRSEADQSLFA